MNFIVNKTVKNYFHNYENPDKFVVDIIRVFITLINSIGVLINNKIIHNDLHVNNILINLKNLKPVVIDFGLGLMFSKLYNKRDNTFDFKYLRNLIFDFRDDQYHVILEKRFLSFIIYNKSEYYNINITNQYEKNELTKYIIDIFINDAYDSISNQSIIFLSKIELAEYLKSLKQFYYQFLNKYKFPDYASIVSYLITFTIKYTDLYSLVFDIYYIYSTSITYNVQIIKFIRKFPCKFPVY
jgi:serine/threonine protein kinase